MKKAKTFNRGEWSEVYSFLKILSDGFLFGSTAKLDVSKHKFRVVYIKQISETDSLDLFFYPNGKVVKLITNKIETLIKSSEFEVIHKLILKEIINNEAKTFNIPEVDIFFKKLLSPRLKSPNHKKRDLTISVENLNPRMALEYGFSVKSNLAGSSTLLNASSGTNFIYKLGMTACKSNKIYESLSCKNLIECLISNKVKIEFLKMESGIYDYNLGLIDTRMPEIISSFLLSYFSKKGTLCSDLLSAIEKENPMQFKNTDYYKVKLLDFLTATALGMVPKTKWDKKYDSNGGLIVVKDSCDISTFYIVHP